MRTNRPARLKTFDYLGCHRYSLTFCTQFRQALFTDAEVVAVVLSQFSRAADQERFAILAYCFMPDHVHLLIEGESPDSDCKRFIKLSKQYAGYTYSRRFRGQLWQPWGFEHVLRNNERMITHARYILENPVRAGLTTSVMEYPYVGSLKYDVKDLLAGLPDR